ncbi:hypothetical protein ABZ815_20565 [Nonomuraea sp. NPDC047529]|uniref:hypothetical protein n=1 Tax=Nonomuraea sp. NPDC047529 TaxID=3155623 RepID=UPI0033FB8626
MNLLTQVITIAAVIVGAVVTYATNSATERSRHRRQLQIRWDERNLEAYADYIGKVRSCIYSAVRLYESPREPDSPGGQWGQLLDALTAAEGQRAVAFERVMLLANDQVIEKAHEVNMAAARIDWAARRRIECSLEEWRSLHRAVFAAINRLHQCARQDLKVPGLFISDQHTGRGLTLPDSDQ